MCEKNVLHVNFAADSLRISPLYIEGIKSTVKIIISKLHAQLHFSVEKFCCIFITVYCWPEGFSFLCSELDRCVWEVFGLSVNWLKSSHMPLSSKCMLNSGGSLCGLQISSSIKYLGVHLLSDCRNSPSINVDPLLDLCKTKFKMWTALLVLLQVPPVAICTLCPISCSQIVYLCLGAAADGGRAWQEKLYKMECCNYSSTVIHSGSKFANVT